MNKKLRITIAGGTGEKGGKEERAEVRKQVTEIPCHHRRQ
jgi:hypothetical protein